MKKLVFLISLASLIACGGEPDNTLTVGEQNDGWKLLFDGTSLTGWRGFNNKPIPAWSVENGQIVCGGSENDKGDMRPDLTTNGQYENFELSVDWKISAQSNSGIIYLAAEGFSAPWMTGPEYQIIDDNNFPEKLENWQKTGANYAMYPPTALASKPAGEWNKTRIKLQDGKVEHWLNGVKVVDCTMWTPEWQREKETGKWKEYPDYGLSHKGHICLQDHGSKVCFKNIKIKEL